MRTLSLFLRISVSAIFLFVSTFVHGQCQITEINMGLYQCINAEFQVDLDLVYQDNVSEFFELQILDESDMVIFEDLLPYASLPVTIFVPASNATILLAVVTDAGDPNCSKEAFLDNACFPEDCVISNVTSSNTECFDSEYFITTIDFDYINTASDMFTYEISGGIEGSFLYSQLPVQIEVFPTVDWDFLTLTIEDSADPSCQAAYDLPNECAGMINCSITDLSAEVLMCEDGLWSVVVDFEYQNTGDFFDLHINYNQGVIVENILYSDLPYTVEGLAEECVSDIDIIVYESSDDGCFEAIGFDPVCCPIDCALSNLSLDLGPCIDGASVLIIDFDYEGTTSDFFDLLIPGFIDGFFLFSDLPLSLTIQNVDIPIFEVLINENDNPNCNTGGAFDNPCYSQEECVFGDLELSVADCVGDDEVQMTIDFSYNVGASDFFEWEVPGGNLPGGGSGVVPYADLPITLFAYNNSDAILELIITDQQDPDCQIAVTFDNPCYDPGACHLTALYYEGELECVDDLIIGQFYIEEDIPNEEGYDVYVDGTYIYSIEYDGSGPYTLEIPTSDMVLFVLEVCREDIDGCCIGLDIEDPCYEDTTEDCLIDDVIAEVTACEGDLFDVEIDFFHEGTTNQFTVQGNGISYGTFTYNDLPITLTGLVADCETAYEFVVSDVIENNCTAFAEIGEVCCDVPECELNTLDFGDNPICENGLIITEWLIGGENLSEVGFDIFINGAFQLFVEYNDSNWYDFDVVAPDTEFFSITVCDNDNADCCIDWELENPCYEDTTEDCLIDDVIAEVTACEGDLFDVEIDFFHEGTTNQFTVQGNGISYGTFSYNDLPITLTGLVADCETAYEFVVSDVIENNCTAFVEIGEVCCDEPECELNTLDFGDNPICENGLIITQWLIGGENMSEVGFDIFINGAFQLFVEYNDSDWYDFDIVAPDTEFFSITVCDNDNADCCIDWELENPCYEDTTEDCLIDDVIAEVTACEGDLFDVEIDFFHEGTTNQFTVQGNGISYGTFSYNDLPITLTGLVADCETAYEFVVSDVIENNCTAFVEIGEVCCDVPECELNTLDFGDNPICENGLIITQWLIGGENMSEVGFDIFINGAFQLFVEYNDSDWYDFDIVAPDTEFFSITVCDNDNADCCIDWELENPCYEDTTEDCLIDDVIAEVTACEGDLFDVEIDFFHEGTTNQFTVQGNGISYGTFTYNDLPITLTGLVADCETAYEFAVSDVIENNCTAFVEIGEVCCENYNNIDEVVVTNIILEDTIMITLDILSDLLPGCEIDVVVDEEYLVTLSGDDLSVDLGSFACSTDEVLTLQLLNTCTDEIYDFEIDVSEIECITSISEIDLSQYLIYDQIDQRLMLSDAYHGAAEITIIALDGTRVTNYELVTAAWNTSLSLPSGIYIVQLIDKDLGATGYKKIFCR